MADEKRDPSTQILKYFSDIDTMLLKYKRASAFERQMMLVEAMFVIESRLPNTLENKPEAITAIVELAYANALFQYAHTIHAIENQKLFKVPEEIYLTAKNLESKSLIEDFAFPQQGKMTLHKPLSEYTPKKWSGLNEAIFESVATSPLPNNALYPLPIYSNPPAKQTMQIVYTDAEGKTRYKAIDVTSMSEEKLYEQAFNNIKDKLPESERDKPEILTAFKNHCQLITVKDYQNTSISETDNLSHMLLYNQAFEQWLIDNKYCDATNTPSAAKPAYFDKEETSNHLIAAASQINELNKGMPPSCISNYKQQRTDIIKYGYKILELNAQLAGKSQNIFKRDYIKAIKDVLKTEVKDPKFREKLAKELARLDLSKSVGKTAFDYTLGIIHNTFKNFSNKCDAVIWDTKNTDEMQKLKYKIGMVLATIAYVIAVVTFRIALGAVLGAVVSAGFSGLDFGVSSLVGAVVGGILGIKMAIQGLNDVDASSEIYKQRMGTDEETHEQRVNKMAQFTAKIETPFDIKSGKGSMISELLITEPEAVANAIQQIPRAYNLGFLSDRNKGDEDNESSKLTDLDSNSSNSNI